MKKGFTMIELIFVIVILGILASVAIPRLAATRTDAEIATTVANLRTLLIDLNSYYVVKGKFAGAKWNEITNVPLKDHGGVPVANQTTGVEASLYIGGTRCIGVTLVDKDKFGILPAYIRFFTGNTKVSDLCKQVLAAEPIKAYTESKIRDALPGTMAIGSSTISY